MEGGYMEFKSVNEIRSEVKKNVGKEVTLKADKGRKRIVTKSGDRNWFGDQKTVSETAMVTKGKFLVVGIDSGDQNSAL